MHSSDKHLSNTFEERRFYMIYKKKLKSFSNSEPTNTDFLVSALIEDDIHFSGIRIIQASNGNCQVSISWWKTVLFRAEKNVFFLSYIGIIITNCPNFKSKDIFVTI